VQIALQELRQSVAPQNLRQLLAYLDSNNGGSVNSCHGWTVGFESRQHMPVLPLQLLHMYSLQKHHEKCILDTILAALFLELSDMSPGVSIISSVDDQDVKAILVNLVSTSHCKMI